MAVVGISWRSAQRVSWQHARAWRCVRGEAGARLLVLKLEAPAQRLAQRPLQRINLLTDQKEAAAANLSAQQHGVKGGVAVLVEDCGESVRVAVHDRLEQLVLPSLYRWPSLARPSSRHRKLDVFAKLDAFGWVGFS